MDRVDRFLSRPHRRNVVVERYEPVAGRRAEPGERQQLVAMVALLVEALLQHGAEVVPEVGIFIGGLAGFFAELA